MRCNAPLFASVIALTLIVTSINTRDGSNAYADVGAQPRDGESDCNTNGIPDEMELSPMGGNVLLFDGDNDYVVPGESWALDGLGQEDFTVEAWIWTADTGHSILVGNAGEAPQLWNFVIRGEDEGGVVRLRFKSGDEAGVCDGVTPVTDGAWHHVAGVRRVGPTGSLSVYVDGILDATTEMNSPPFIATNQTYIGREAYGSTSRWFNGAMDEVRIWHGARSSAEIADNMYESLTGTEYGLVGYWRFDESAGTTAADSTGGSSATLIGPPEWVLQASDCNSNGIMDECEAIGSDDCNTNGVPDLCDILNGTSTDCNTNGVPDECEAGGTEDCNTNGVSICATSITDQRDCNGTGVPDECETLPTALFLSMTTQQRGEQRVELGRRICRSPTRSGTRRVQQLGHRDSRGRGDLQAGHVARRLIPVGKRRGVAWWLSWPGRRSRRAGRRSRRQLLPEHPKRRHRQRWRRVGQLLPRCDRQLHGHDGRNRGFTISGGNDDRSSPDGDGGGVYISIGSPAFTDCIISGNFAVSEGGGMYITESTPTLIRCAFMGNSTDGKGGGLCNKDGSNSTLSQCSFNGNSASYGGGMSNENSSPNMDKCIFNGNSAENNGGGLRNYNYGSPTMSDCVFNGNSAVNGGGVDNSNSSKPTMTNCTFRGNSADHGGGLHNYKSSRNCSSARSAATRPKRAAEWTTSTRADRG